MRIKVDSVAITEVAHLQESALHRPGRSVAALIAVLLLGACSSRNPDSLIGMNLDENLAMTNASEAPDANLAAADASAASNSATDFHPSNQSARTAAEESIRQAPSSTSAEVNGADPVAPSEEDDTSQTTDEPNAT